MMSTETPPREANGQRTAGFLSRFRRDKRGNTALVFALVLTPVAILSFGSVDFYRTSTAQANLQDALDSATLIVARARTSDAAQIQSIGMTSLQAGLASYRGTTLNVDPAVTRFRLINGRIVGDAEVAVTPFVAQFFLADGRNLRATAHSEVVRGLTRVEVSMVLDVTGSMNEAGQDGVSKISRLREAATALVNSLETASQQSAEPNAVRIAMVPFSSSVNVGTANRNASWIVDSANQTTTSSHALNNQIFTNSTGNPGTATANRFSLLNQIGVSWGGCVEARPAPYDVQDTAASTGVPNSLYVPYFAPDEPGTGDGFTSSDQTRLQQGQVTYFNDYLPDNLSGTPSEQYKQGNLGKYNRAPTKTGTIPLLQQLGFGTYSYGPNFGCVSSPIVPLSTNFSALRTAISGLTASGETNIPLGLVWGWNTVSPNGPFSTARGVAYNDPDTTKVIVLMTDGNNTNYDLGANFNNSMYSSIGFLRQNRIGITDGTQAQRTAQMNSRLQTLCTNLRNQGVVVYTVRVEVTSGDSSVLRNCATEPAYYYDVQNAANLADAFRSIAGSITRLRIAN